jgi:hypothetical protein
MFMAHTREYPCDDAWYMDGDATNHMINWLDWFASFDDIPQGHLFMMIIDNCKLWVWGIGRVQMQC